MRGALLIPALCLPISASAETSARPCVPWRHIAAPSVADWTNTLFGIAGRSSADVWAVGSYDFSNGDERTYALHWDGRNWSLSATPNAPNDNRLTDVAVVGASEAWAVGYHLRDDHYKAGLVQHWDGRTWTITPLPDTGWETRLFGVDGVASNDVWAVGSAQGRALVLHWDGVAWRVAPVPRIARLRSEFYAVDARSRTDVWAVGYTAPERYPLIARWNGRAWRVTIMPRVGGGTLYGVAAISPTRAWAVGDKPPKRIGARHATLTVRWNGKRWGVVPSPTNRYVDTWLFGVAPQRTAVWAVGAYDVEQRTYPLTLRWDGRRWRRVRTAPVGQGTLNATAMLGPRDGWAVGEGERGLVLTQRLVGCR